MTDQEIQDLISTACGNRDDAMERDQDHRNNCRRVENTRVQRRVSGYIAGAPAKYEGQAPTNEFGESFARYSGVKL